MKPWTIRWFDRLYLSSIVLSLVSVVLMWDDDLAALYDMSEVRPYAAMIIGGLHFLITSINVSFWTLVSIRRSRMAVFLLLCFAFCNVLWLATLIFAPELTEFPYDAGGIVFLLSHLFYIVSVVLLLPKLSWRWLRGDNTVPDDDLKSVFN
ncbi:MAG: hypothetical protein AAGH53_04660 [Pseudomonadota bacterium]